MYVLDMACISPQNTFDGKFFGSDIVPLGTKNMRAIEPEYKDIPNGILRRMSNSIRMATGAGIPLLQKWPVDGIILGTSDGGMADCHSFLNQMVEYEEGTLTPTRFIQGAPSSIAGTLALMSKNTGYNNTHSNLGLSFEGSLLDAMLLFDEGAINKLLVGAVEEISIAQQRLAYLARKLEDTLDDQVIMDQKIYGEGVSLFVLGNDKSSAMAQIVETDTICYPSDEDLDELINKLLDRSNTSAESVDMVMIGSQSTRETDLLYKPFVERHFPNAGLSTYKRLFGESSSSTAFATWLAVHVLNGEKLPVELSIGGQDHEPEQILIYNQFRGCQHGFILLRKG